MSEVHVTTHPMIADRLTRMRKKETSSEDFRKLLHEITLLLGYEATADLPLVQKDIETPICVAALPVLDDIEFTIVPILRAGIGMIEGMLELLPSAHVGHIGLQRNEQTHKPEEYYWKMPPNLSDTLVFVVDPMLATGGSAVGAVDGLKRSGCKNIRMINIVAAPQGLEAMMSAHPDVDIYVAAIDDGLNENAYIVPGLGDAGDRIFKTL